MTNYYEVLVADNRYHSDKPLTYESDLKLSPGNIVTIPLQKRQVTGFVIAKVSKPKFATKPVKSLYTPAALPAHALPFARWLADYYGADFSECLRQFAPSKPIVRRKAEVPAAPLEELQLSVNQPLTGDQKQALKAIKAAKSTTVLLHGETGTGKTRVYLELAEQVLRSGRSVIILTPEIGLTAQLAEVIKQQIKRPVFILHSELPAAERKRLWLNILEATEPVAVVGPRSALFAPVQKLGLVVVDEAHEPAYKQEQAPRYHAVRAASQLGQLTDAKVVLSTATPSLSDFYIASQHGAVVRMTEMAAGQPKKGAEIELVDMKNRANLSTTPYFSKKLIESLKQTLSSGHQAMIYLNRRGSARVILCQNCGWQLVCPNCDIPLVYHADHHQARCHTCGYKTTPPGACPQCQSPDIVYKSAGTKALAAELAKLFPNAKIARFDSDNDPAERLNQLYPAVRQGKVDILVGTQLLAKGLDLPKLSLVGVINADSALALPDFSAEERAFQLLYQVIGRVGRGHLAGRAIIQSYEPDSELIQAAVTRDYPRFYEIALKERQAFKWPPYSYLMQLKCRRLSAASAEQAATKLRDKLSALPSDQRIPVEIIGPTPAFYARHGHQHYWQLVIKAKQRSTLLELAKQVPTDWSVDVDPVDLL